MDGDGTNYRCTHQPSILCVPLNKEMETDCKSNSLCTFLYFLFHVGDVGRGSSLVGAVSKVFIPASGSRAEAAPIGQ